MTTNPPLQFPLATGRLLADTSEMEWTQYTYWIESNGPLVVISEQQRLVAYVADDPAANVPEPTYALMAAFLLVLAIVIRWRFR
jgi:hypothetical protein